MVGKNNKKAQKEICTDKVTKYSLRKFKNGVGSAVIGAVLLAGMNSVEVAQAEEVNEEETVQVEEIIEDEQEVEVEEATEEIENHDVEVAQVEEAATPAAPRIATIASNDTSLSIVAPNEGDTVRVTIPGVTEPLEFVAKRFGNVPVILPDSVSLTPGDVVTAVTVSAEGHLSEMASATVVDPEVMAGLDLDPVVPGSEYITGRVNPAAESVAIRVQGGASRSASSISEDGSFRIRLYNDSARLETGQPVQVDVRVDGKTYKLERLVSAQPATPTVTPFSQYANIISVKADANHAVIVTLPDGTELTGRTNRWGLVNLNVAEGTVLNLGDTVSVVAVNDDGVTSETFTYEIRNFAEEFQFTVEPVLAGEASGPFSGTALPGSYVTMHFPTSSQAAQADENGNWVINTRRNLAPGTIINVSIAVNGVSYRNALQVVAEEEPGDISVEESTLVVARLGAYGSRYYRLNFTLVDARGNAIEGLTEEDFSVLGFGGIANFEADGNVYRIDTEYADDLRPDYTWSVENGVVTVDIEEEPGDISVEESTLVVARLGAYGSRYYRLNFTLVDERGNAIEGLTEEDFSVLGFGGIANFEADGNVYRIDTEYADDLRPDYTWSVENGVVTTNLVEEVGDISADESTLVVARLGAYGSRYYRLNFTLVDERGNAIEGLTEEDFNVLGFGGIANFEADGNVYRIDTEYAADLRPDYTWSVENGVVTTNLVEEVGDISADESTLVVARLGAYGSRYYRLNFTLVDERGNAIEGLTEEDFNVLGYGGIVNFEADGNVYRIDTEYADDLRPDYTWSVENGVISVVIDEEQAIDFETIYRANGELAYGERVVVQEGRAGVMLNGEVVREAVDEIVEVGNVMRRYQNEAFYREYVADSNLAYGEQAVLEEGHRGEYYLVHVWEVNPETGALFNRGAGVVDPDTVVRAQNRIIGVGNVMSDTNELNFETIREVNYDLAPGEVRVVQEGQVGIETVTTTYEVDPSTGQLVNPVTETVQTQDPVNERIEYGVEISDLEERLAVLEALIDQLAAQNAELTEQLAALRAEIAEANRVTAELEARLAELEARVAELEAEADADEDEDDQTSEENPEDEHATDSGESDDATDEEDDNKDAEEDSKEDKSGASEDEKDGDDEKTSTDKDLPKAGAASTPIGLAIGTILSGLGLSVFAGKRKNEED